MTLRIHANGRTVPENVVPRFFEIFALGAEPLTPGGGLGLAPAVAAQILRLVQGSIALEPRPDGITFLVKLQTDGRTIGPGQEESSLPVGG